MDCVVTCMLKMWIMPLLAFDLTHCHSVTVSSVRYTKHCVDGQPSEHSLWHTLVTSSSCGVV